MRIYFSVDLHDIEGDVYERCILLHIGSESPLIIKVKDSDELRSLIEGLQLCERAIKREGLQR